MATGMPELGSKISLISKADIRYEGRLFTVDPQECTIALASVRSFGTEDRESPFPVPAQTQVYDYILFRGSDIKDIRVMNNVPPPQQPLNDPAIMQLSVPPSMAGAQFQTHPLLGPIGAPLGQFGGYGGPFGPMGGSIAAAMQHQVTSVAGGSSLRGPPPTSVLELIGGGTRSTTPASLGSRKSPTNDQAVQAGGNISGGSGAGRSTSSGRDKKVMRPIQPPNQQQHPHQSNQQQNRSRERQGMGRSRDGQVDYRQQQHSQNSSQNHQHQVGGRPQNNRHQYNHQNSSGSSGYHQYQGSYQQPQRGGWIPRGAMRSRGGGGPNNISGTGKFNGPRQNPGQLGPKKNTLKFDNEYDFELANSEFEEVLKNELSKIKLDDTTTGPTAKAEMNGETDKKDDSGNETGAGEPEQEDDQQHEVFYDKTKSFFDKISCEAVERAKGKCPRTDWRTERKLNSETFGVSATRRGGYYNYRGRGGFRGMGFRGGYRGGYRPPQQQQQQPLRRDYNQSQPQHSQKQPSSSSTTSTNQSSQQSQAQARH